MTDLVGKVRDALGNDRWVDADRLLARIEATDRFLRAAEGYLPDDRLVAAHTVVERAGTRLALSREHTVVALAGATGSGKSSLFNALARVDLSPVGVRRPTTSAAYACVWGQSAGASELLDWIGVLPRHRFVRDGPLTGDAERALRGLVLLDLPDFDSIERTHRVEVDRLLGLVDVMVWVVDPQKYADRLVHAGYLQRFRRYQDVAMVVLNQADLLTPTDLARVVDDLRRLLDADGLDDVPLLTTSALSQAGVANLRNVLERAVASRHAALWRLAADIDAVTGELSSLVGPTPTPVDVEPAVERRFINALADAAGVPIAVERVEITYRQRATRHTGWPPARGLRWLRPDPIRRLHHVDRGDADRSELEHPATATSLPATPTTDRAAVGLAVRAVADQAGKGLPEPWRNALTAAARSRLDELPDALDRAVGAIDPAGARTRLWWRLVAVGQLLLTVAAVAGLGWLLAGYLVRTLGLPALDYPMVGLVPVPTLMLLGGLALGLIIAAAASPVVSVAARRTRRRVEHQLRSAVAEVAREQVITPVTKVRRRHAEAADAFSAMRKQR